MKRFLSLLLMACFALGTVALADVSHASLIQVKRKKGRKGHPATRHKAHKVTRHKAPKHTT